MTRTQPGAPGARAKPAGAARQALAAAGAGAGVIKTAGRVFQVLEYMRELRRPLTVRMVSERLGYPKSSALVLLKSMAALGYLRYDAQDHSFFASARLAALGDWVLDAMQLGGRFLSVIQEIARATQETTILAIENDIYAQYVHVVLSGQAIQYYVQPGTRRLLAMSGIGWALLSARSDDEIAHIVQRTNARLATSGQSVQPDLVLRHVQQTRSQGHSFSRGTVTEGVGVIAMALPETLTGERLAIGVGGFVKRLEHSREAIVAALHRQLAGVSGTP